MSGHRRDVAPPWHGGLFDLPEEPTDGEIRRALQHLCCGGALGGSALWSTACTRRIHRSGPEEGGEAAYARVDEILSKLERVRVTGVLAKAGRGQPA